MSKAGKILGKQGEDLAKRFLERKGFLFLDRNFQVRMGEIDLIMKDAKADEIVFIEVKTRQRQEHFFGEESVDFIKMRKMKVAAELYILRKGLEDEYCRFDVVVVEVRLGKAKVLHLKSVY